MTGAPLQILRARVDNRLVHGQILEAWMPALGADAIVVADDEVAGNMLMRSAMAIALPKKMKLHVARVDQLRALLESAGPGGALLLFRDVHDAVRAYSAGLPLAALDIGNVHFAQGRRPITPSIFLANDEIAQLTRLAADGVRVEVKTLPTDPPSPLVAGMFAKAT